MLQLDFGDHRPLYEQICDKIKGLIISGVLGENEKIPSVRELAASLAINPNTIQKAYKELENDGYIYSLKAKGNFVSPREKNPDSQKAEALNHDLKATVSELKYIGVAQEELFRLITEIYKEEQP